MGEAVCSKSFLSVGVIVRVCVGVGVFVADSKEMRGVGVVSVRTEGVGYMDTLSGVGIGVSEIEIFVLGVGSVTCEEVIDSVGLWAETLGAKERPTNTGRSGCTSN